MPTVTGDMSKWMQSLINMIDILLKINHFQRIENETVIFRQYESFYLRAFHLIDIIMLKT